MPPCDHPGASLAVLLVDDEESSLLVRDMLGRQQLSRCSVERCSDPGRARRTIGEGRHDVYLVAQRLGADDGLDLAREAFTLHPSAAVILLTSHGDSQLDLGVTDVLAKEELSPATLGRTIRAAVRHQRALHELARSEERYELAARAVNDGIWDWDLTTGQVHFSARWHSLLGRVPSFGPLDVSTWLDLVHAADLPVVRAAIDAHLHGGAGHLESGHLELEHRVRHADGTWRWVLARGLAVRDGCGRPTRMAGSLSDVTERRRAQDQVQRHAFYDQLTDLPNRALLLDRLELALRHCERDPGLRQAVLLVDLDRFKLVNDSFSHAVGDQLLQAAAARLVDTVRSVDTVARIGGDEFTILVENVPEADVDQVAVNLASRIQEGLARGFVLDGRKLQVTGSVGIAIAAPPMTGAEILRNADIAMYEAKHQGRDAVAVFDDGMHHQISKRVATEVELRQIVEQDLVDVHYQPVIDLISGRLRGFEALARWPSSHRPVPPTEFIPIAEEIGLIRPLGRSVLRKALGQMAAWRHAGLIPDDALMSVNVSARQLDDPSFPDDVLAAIADTDLPGWLVRLEITESTLMRDPARVGPLVSRLGTAGLGLELDDFGTGYSSLAALHQFPVGALKVDRSFVSSLTDRGSSEAIVRSTVALAHSLGLDVIAEGIECHEQLDHLRSLGCEFGQGYLFARPLDASTMTDRLKEPLGPARRSTPSAALG